jgi:hypothetical protein
VSREGEIPIHCPLFPNSHPVTQSKFPGEANEYTKCNREGEDEHAQKLSDLFLFGGSNNTSAFYGAMKVEARFMEIKEVREIILLIFFIYVLILYICYARD